MWLAALQEPEATFAPLKDEWPTTLIKKLIQASDSRPQVAALPIFSLLAPQTRLYLTAATWPEATPAIVTHPVTAPLEADETALAYLAMTPVL
jgi:hypothetical protein